MTNRLLQAAAGILFSSVAAAASPLTLSYQVVPLDDGRIRYRFTLELDNHDSSWEAGQGFGWVVFGDGVGATTSLPDFIGDAGSFPAGPWDRFDATAGYNNGPSLGALRALWFPRFVGDSISWSGTSFSDVATGQLRWSCLTTQGRAGPIEGENALYVSRCGRADINADGFLDGSDFDTFVAMYLVGDPAADLDRSGFVGPDDWELFLAAFAGGC